MQSEPLQPKNTIIVFVTTFLQQGDLKIVINI